MSSFIHKMRKSIHTQVKHGIKYGTSLTANFNIFLCYGSLNEIGCYYNDLWLGCRLQDTCKSFNDDILAFIFSIYTDYYNYYYMQMRRNGSHEAALISKHHSRTAWDYNKNYFQNTAAKGISNLQPPAWHYQLNKQLRMEAGSEVFFKLGSNMTYIWNCGL